MVIQSSVRLSSLAERNIDTIVNKKVTFINNSGQYQVKYNSGLDYFKSGQKKIYKPSATMVKQERQKFKNAFISAQLTENIFNNFNYETNYHVDHVGTLNAADIIKKYLTLLSTSCSTIGSFKDHITVANKVGIDEFLMKETKLVIMGDGFPTSVTVSNITGVTLVIVCFKGWKRGSHSLWSVLPLAIALSKDDTREVQQLVLRICNIIETSLIHPIMMNHNGMNYKLVLKDAKPKITMIILIGYQGTVFQKPTYLQGPRYLIYNAVAAF